MNTIKIIAINKIKDKSNPDYKVRFDNGEELYLWESEVLKYSIHPEDEFSKTEFNDFIRNIENDRTYYKGLNILLFKKNSKSELCNKLKERGHNSDSIEDAINELEKNGYIDDARYTKYYILKSKNGKYKTKYQIEQELLRKGVDTVIISEALEDFFEEEEEEIDKIKQFMNNKYNKLFDSGKMEYNDIAKIKRALYSRGYKPESIDRAIREIWKDNEE